MENQWLIASSSDPLSRTSPANKIDSKFEDLPVLHIPGHHLHAPPIHCKVEVKADPFNACWQIRNVQAPDLVEPISPQPRHGSSFVLKPAQSRSPKNRQGPANNAPLLGRRKDQAWPLRGPCNSLRGEAQERCPTPFLPWRSARPPAAKSVPW